MIRESLSLNSLMEAERQEVNCINQLKGNIQLKYVMKETYKERETTTAEDWKSVSRTSHMSLWCQWMLLRKR